LAHIHGADIAAGDLEEVRAALGIPPLPSPAPAARRAG